MHPPSPFDLMLDIVAMFVGILTSLYLMVTIQYVSEGEIKSILKWYLASFSLLALHMLIMVLGAHVFAQYDEPMNVIANILFATGMMCGMYAAYMTLQFFRSISFKRR